jgi:hypothetical protein
MSMLERKLIRLAIAIGAAVWLARIAFSRSERDKLDAAVQALDEAPAHPGARSS